MINIDDTESLDIILQDDVVTNELRYELSYAQLDGDTLELYGFASGLTTGNTVKTMASPPAGKTWTIKAISIFGNDTVSATASIGRNSGGGIKPIIKKAVGSGQSLIYERGAGWTLHDPGLISASNVLIDNDDLCLAVNSTPTPPPTDYVKIFNRKIANRNLLAMIGPSGLDMAVQPNMARNKIGIWVPPGNATTVPGVFGFTAYTATGTATARNIATTSIFTRMRRLGYVSAAGAGSLAGPRVAAAQITLGTVISDVDTGGFFKVIRFGISDAASVSGARMFVGVSSSTGAPTNVEPSTLTNSIGVGHGASDTNLKIYYGGSAAQTPVDLGANFPITHGSAYVYELALFSPPGIDNIVYYEVTNITTGNSVSGTLTGTSGTVLPAPTTLLTYSQNWRSNNATALAVAIDIMSDYIETDQ